jgi:hypothetical protein
MEWHWHELSSLFHHLPHSVAELLHHEDPAIVKAGIMDFVVQPPASSGVIAIEKDIDPAVSRSQQNMELLLRDYLHTLPVFVPNSKAAEQLLEHWRKIMLDQPQRIAEAKESFWHSEKAKAYWQERLKHVAPDHVIYQGEWELAAGTPIPPPEIMNLMEQKKWRDLVIQQRLHVVTEHLNRNR